MSSLVRTIYAYLPVDSGYSAWLAKIGRAIDRYRTYEKLRQAKYPWNALLHRARWMFSSADSIAAWTERQLALHTSNWIFIAGCNNSGTTLLSRVLGSNPRIRPLPREGQALTRALPRPSHMGVARLFAQRLDALRWTESSDARPALKAKYDWSRYFPPGPGHLLMKSPENTLRTRWLQHNFAPSRFVTIFRSPYAVCEGTRRRSGHSIEDAATHWTVVNECLLTDIACLERCHRLKYEEFCERPAEHLHQLEAFLQLETPFSEDALRPQKVHNIESRASPIQNFNAKSLERLSPSDIDTINRIAGPVMDRLGYDKLTSPG
jgi:hypothetical protein